MRVCRWCGTRIRWPWEYCLRCKGGYRFMSLDLPSPPCHYMEDLPEAGESFADNRRRHSKEGTHRG